MKKARQSFLWEINRADLAAPSYLFGTMHVQDQRAFRTLDQVLEKIEACEAFATEFNLDEVGQLAFDERLRLPEGQSLEMLLGQRKYERLKYILSKAFSFDPTPFARFLPIIIVNFLQRQILSSDMPFALDEYLFQQAKAKGKHLMGIETLQEQIEILSKIPLELQLKSLLEIGRNPSRFRRQLKKMADWYAKEDYKQVYRAARRSASGIRKLLLTDRNLLMAERIAQLVLDKPTVFAIGAGHLSGKMGVLRLLKKRDFVLNSLYTL